MYIELSTSTVSPLRLQADGELGITDEPDLSLVSLSSDRTLSKSIPSSSPQRCSKTSFPEQPRNHLKNLSDVSEGPDMSPDRTLTSFSVATGTSPDYSSQSLLSFERHEGSLLTSTEYSLLQSAEKDTKFAVLSVPVSV